MIIYKCEIRDNITSLKSNVIQIEDFLFPCCILPEENEMIRIKYEK